MKEVDFTTPDAKCLILAEIHSEVLKNSSRV